MIAVNDTTLTLDGRGKQIYDNAGNIATTAQENVMQNLQDGGSSRDAIESELNKRWLAVNAPELDRQQKAQEALFRARGVGMDSEAGSRYAARIARQRSDAENRAFLSNYTTAANVFNADRSFNLNAAGAGINQRNAVQQPLLAMAGQAHGTGQVAPVDTTAIANSAYQNYQQYNQAKSQPLRDLIDTGTKLGAAYLSGGTWA